MADFRSSYLEWASTLSLIKGSDRILLKTILERPDGVEGLIGQKVVVCGWVRSNRQEKDLAAEPTVHEPLRWILQVSDSSCAASLFRIIVDRSTVTPNYDFPVRSCVLAEGVLQRPSSLQDNEMFEVIAGKFIPNYVRQLTSY